MDDDHEVSALFGSGEAMLREALSAKRDECLRLRDRLAEVEARCAEVERERDEALDGRSRDALSLHDELNSNARSANLALAASQAECARLREAMEAAPMEQHAHDCPTMRTGIGSDCACGAWEHNERRATALASAPGSTDALREVVAAALAVQREISTQQYGVALSEGSIAAIVSRILGERSDDAPQGRGERGKEGGDANSA